MFNALIQPNSAGKPIGDLIVTGLITGVISIIIGLILARLTFNFVKRPELRTTLDNKIREIEQTHALKKEEIQAAVRAELEAEKERQKLARADQVRRQVVACAGPILVSVRDLIDRLDNIIDRHGYAPLEEDWDQKKPPAWSSNHEYFMSSTLYVFGRYFAWVQILRDRLGADEYITQTEKDALLKRLQKVATTLSSYPAPYSNTCTGGDAQVFSWQQSAMGEVLIQKSQDTTSVSGYSTFLDEKEKFGAHFEPLHTLLVNIGPEPISNCRWLRLASTRDALISVRDECELILNSD